MFNSTKQFLDVLDAEDTRYNFSESDDSSIERVTMNFTGENMSSLRITFFFDKDEHSAAVRIFDVAKTTENKKVAMLTAVNKINSSYRFVKFCLEEDNTVQLEGDCIFRDNDVGQICGEFLYRALKICDDAYPEFMKVQWA